MKDATKRISLFLQRYPQVYHVSLCSNPRTVVELGLLSAAGILNLLELPTSLRKPLQESQRKAITRLSHPVHGLFFLNDQIPLAPAALDRCLQGSTVTEWYEELNHRIFFWLSRSRVDRFAAARKAISPARTLFVLNTEQLLGTQPESFDLCHFNSGSAIRKAVPRSLASFQSLAVYPLVERARQYGWKRAAVELSTRRNQLVIQNAIERIETL